MAETQGRLGAHRASLGSPHAAPPTGLRLAPGGAGGEGRDTRFHRRLRAGVALLAVLGALLVAYRLSARLAPIHASDLEESTGRLVHMTDRNGCPIGSVLADGASPCQPVRLEQVSPALVQAFVAAEDRRFYQHHGVDYAAIGRASVQNVLALRTVSGGSTITMQLARLLRPGGRTPLGKLREMHTAWRLEAGMSKREILEAYLNRVPMGGNLVGVGVASRAFFDRDPGELTLAEAALLASIPKDPARSDPRLRPERVEARRAYVLRQMVRAGYATPEEAELARKSRPGIRSSGDPLAAYQFFFDVLRTAPKGASAIRLTLDRDIQRMAAEQVRITVADLAEHNATNAAAIVLDNRTRHVLAYVGSASYLDEEHSGRVDGVRAARQPGSTLKPFVYALALERGFTPATVLPDVPSAYPMAPGQHYEPENYSNVFHGPVLLRSALANSLNVPACHVASQVGVPEVLEQLHRFGFDSLDRTADYYGLGVVLGGGEVTLYELARAYMALANGGRFADQVELLEVDGREQAPAAATERVCAPPTSYLITDILSDQSARALAFGQRSPLNLPFPCAAKTGTSSGHRDNWAVGYTPDYTVAVWVGNFDGGEMHDVSGISGAGPLFARIMYHVERNQPEPDPRPIPPGLVSRPICSLSGKRPGPYCPHVRDELFLDQDLAAYESDVCDWHRAARTDGAAASPAPGDVRTVIPAEFRVGEGE